MPIDMLVSEVKAKQAQGSQQPVVISASKSARYEDVMHILDLLQRSGIKRVGLLARPNPG